MSNVFFEAVEPCSRDEWTGWGVCVMAIGARVLPRCGKKALDGSLGPPGTYSACSNLFSYPAAQVGTGHCNREENYKGLC